MPLLLTHRGQVGADTKSYLTIDPGRLIDRAWSMWDPNIGLGTVTHQNIGYLWPMGPWYWAFETLGVPDWLTQRLWLGSIMFLAGLGVRYLLRTLGQDGPSVTAAMFVYALSPYVLTLAARISAILLPFTALPWMIALTIRAIRERTWWYPALFALLIATIGSTNATALLLSGLGPALWVVYAVFIAREAPLRQAAGAVLRIGVLSIGASLWWIAGLYCQGAYGIDILRYSETARTVAEASTAPELLRNLGYWFFYGGDKVGPWIEPSVPYTQSLALIFATYLLAILGLLAAGVTRWRYRAYFVSLVAVGLVAAVGAHPWDDPPLFGEGLKQFLLSDAGLAMRSLPRAVPLLALGLAVLLGMGITSLAAKARSLGPGLAAGVAVLAVLCLPPLWTGDMVAENLQRPEDLPEYWIDAANFLELRGQTTDGWATRVMEMPGTDFASYRWGNTVDPITPGLMDRPYIARELIPYGTPGSADLLNAYDGRLQEDTLDSVAIAPLSRFMGVGDIVLRNDLQYERYNLARPRQTWDLFRSAPDLLPVAGFGKGENVPDPTLPLQDELELASPPDLPNPTLVAVLGVEHPAGIFRATPADAPVLLAGDGDGLVDVASAGLVNGTEAVLYSASFAGDAPALQRELDRPGAVLVLTDGNRRAGRRWSTVRENEGYTEEAGEEPLRDDPTDNRLPLFPDAGDDAATVAQHRGGVHARATAYGNPITFTAEDRAANAVDDDRRTAWQVGAFSPVVGEQIELRYDEPRTTDRIIVQQADNGVQNRWITRARLRFDDGDPVDVDLTPASRAEPGETVTFPRRTFSTVSIEVLNDDVGERDRYDGLSSVGFADIRLGDGDRRLDEVIRLPRDLLDAAGGGSADQPLAIVLTRQRVRPSIPLRRDVEVALARAFRLPTARAFDVTGQARISPRAPDQVIDRVLGVTGPGGSELTATSSRRLAGDIQARASSAIDGDPATHWSPAYLEQGGDFVRYRLERPVSFDHLDLRLVTDGRHSVPTRIRIEADGETAATLDVPAIRDRSAKDATTVVPLDFPAVTGRDLRFVVEEVRPVRTIDWVSKAPVEAPIGIAELGAPGLRAEVPDGAFDSGCRADLVTVDGDPVPVRVRGDVDEAVEGAGMDLSLCREEVELAAGDHTLRTAAGRDEGIDVDRLVLSSAAADGREVPTAADAADRTGPQITVEDQARTSATVEVGPRDEPTWFVLGQSNSTGWEASAGGRNLGPPTLINGYANGWLLPAGADPLTVELRWTPQRVVVGGLIASALAVIACLVVLVVGIRRRGRPRDPVRTPAGDQPAGFRTSVLWRSDGAPPSVPATVLTVAIATGLTAAVVGPAAGVVVGLATLTVLRVRRARAITVIGPAAALAISGMYTLVSQARNHLPAGFEWPSYFPRVHQVAYVGVALLVVDVVVDRLWTARWWPQPEAARTTADPR